ncbi:MAG: hypothetical protein ACI9NT_000958 [Bacteroidia bacterium]|jgi:hypothetical protein
MLIRLLSVVALPVVAFYSWQAWGHHAFSAEFDKDAPVNLTGTVSKVEWINPHAWIHVDVVAADGSSQTWMVEGGTPNTLLRSGVHKRSLPIGSEVRVRGYQANDKRCEPACKANGRDLTFTDGRQVFMGSSGTGAPKDGSDPRAR